MFILKNGTVQAGFDAQGRLCCLSEGGVNVISSPWETGFRLVYQQGENWEHTTVSRDQTFAVTCGENEISFAAKELVTRRGTAAIALTLRCRLEGGTLVFSAAIENREPGAWVTDFEYPYVGSIGTLNGGRPALLYPRESGVRIPDIGRYLAGGAGQSDNWERAGREINSMSYGFTYPGHASMQWMALEDSGKTLFLQGRDAEHYLTDLRVVASRSAPGEVALVMDKMAFVREGEVWEAPEIRLDLYPGDWHRGASDYAKWAASWRYRHTPPQWMQDMNGYYLVILKQQYGTEMWPYRTLPQLYELAAATGCDTLGLFGWFDSGHDNQYPDLRVSDSLGGEAALREGIRAVRDAGGHVTLYFQGHLIDTGTAYYQNGGDRYVCRSKDGVPYLEWYNKGSASTYQKNFTNKCFATSCPSCPEWRELMEQKADWVESFGPNGVLYDQIGGMPPRPCFDERHDHPKGKPSLSTSGGRKLLLQGLQEHTKALDPQFGFMSERITDVYSAYLDVCHGIGTYPDGEDARAAGHGVENYPELFRFCFPETMITLRNPRPVLDRRAANYAAAFGFKFELEVRYDVDCDEVLAGLYAAEDRYACAVAALRKRHWALLGQGRFVDTVPLREENPHVLAKAFENGDELAVVLWNDSPQEQAFTCTVPGYRLVAVDAPAGPLQSLPERLGPQDLLVLCLQREPQP